MSSPSFPPSPSPSPRHRGTCRPPASDRPSGQPFARIVDLVHDTTDGLAGPTLVGVTYHPTDIGIGTWPLTDDRDPLSHLVGWVAPPEWDALGVSAPGGSWPGEPSTMTGEVVRWTVLLERSREAVMLAEMPRGGPMPQPAFVGPIADVLCRSLGRPAPPPHTTTAAWIELQWLDALAAATLDRPGALSWGRAAALHPLHEGAPVDPETLALATLALEHHDDWATRRARSDLTIDVTRHPSGGRAVSAAEWFDDGSFARWVQRDLPPVADLLDAVLSTAPEHVAARIAAALVAS
jgi:hypothetical protein